MLFLADNTPKPSGLFLASKSNVVNLKYTTLASLTAMIWDMALTLENEVTRVWKVRKTLGTTLFFLNRYAPPLIFVLDIYSQFALGLSSEPPSCRRYQLSSTIFDIFSVSVIECVLILRTNALYQSKKVLLFMVALGFASTSNMLAFFLVVFHHENFVPAAPDRMGCLSGCVGPVCNYLFVAFWVPFFVLETVVFLLTVWKSIQSLRDTQAIGGATVVLDVVIRDGIFYYVVIMGVSIGNFLVWHFNPFAPYLIIPVMKCLQVTICSRIMLNLRGLLDTSPGGGSQVMSGPQATMLDLDSFQRLPEQGDYEEDAI